MVGTDEDADDGIFFYLQAKCRPDFDCLWQKQDSPLSNIQLFSVTLFLLLLMKTKGQHGRLGMRLQKLLKFSYIAIFQ